MNPSEVLRQAARHLEGAVGLNLGSLKAVREKHLSEAVKAALRATLGVAATTRVVSLPDWPSLGRSPTDIVVDELQGSPKPRCIAELKWCQEGHDKVHEAIWDLFKMALMARRPGAESAYLVTGAPAEMWGHAFCRDIFEGGRFSPDELCVRPFPTGKTRRPVWDWLLEGGYDRCPERVPRVIETMPVEPETVSDESRSWELRAVEVRPVGIDEVAFPGGWPNGNRPRGARHPGFAA